jgi:3-dehydroquinate dehydratase-1
MPRPKLIASLAVPGPESLPDDGPQRVAPADLVEVRLDALQGDAVTQAPALCRQVAQWNRPLLLTPRSPGEGGMRRWEPGEREAVLAAVWAEQAAPFLDVELRDSPELLAWALAERPAGVEVIASFHDFQAFPGEERLCQLAEEARNAGANRFKAAVAVAGPEETARLACWTREQGDDGFLATMALGKAGSLSRLMNGIFGSWACYAHIEEATAPGQLAVAELAPLLERFYGG